MEWSTDKVETLKRLWRTDKSAREIGCVLGCSKNAVLGKVDRLGLPERQNGRPMVLEPRRPRRGGGVVPDYASVEEAEANLPATDDPFSPKGCRWVIGDPGMPGARFCQHALADKRFCAAHRSIALRGTARGGGAGVKLGHGATGVWQ